jgi:hypothetical protein
MNTLVAILWTLCWGVSQSGLVDSANRGRRPAALRTWLETPEKKDG